MERTKTMGWKTFMSLLLALCMALTLLSVQAFAASEADPGDTDPEETELLPDPPEQEVEPVPVVVDVLGVELPDCDVVYNGSNQPYPYAELFTGLEGVKSVDISYTGTLPNGNAYELPAPPVNAGSYTVRLALTAEDGYALNADRIEVQMTISKAPQSMPTPPLIADRTISTITLAEISGAEYSMDGGETWQDSPRFTGLSPDTAYRFTQRMKETDNFLPSDSQTVEARTVADTGLRYEIDFYGESIYFDASVVLVSTDRNMTALLTNGASIEPGAVLYLRLIDSGTGEPGSITAETMPDRPDAPDVKADLHSLTVNTTRSMEYSVNGGKTWERCALDMGVSDWTGKKLLVRVAATSNQFSSEAAEISIPARGEKPSVALDTVAETISTTTDMDCSTDNGKTWTPCTGPLDVSALTGADILLRFPGSSAAPPSETATVKIPVRRRAPAVTGTNETRLGYRDGALVRTEKGMEYRITGGNWTEITGSTVAPLAPGTYEVRYAAAETEFVSEIQKVVIAKGELAVAPDSKLSLLNRQDHIAYIVGRTSTQAAPNADITRAEVVTILYRLLTQEAKANYGTSVSPFQDVSANAWYGPAVATLANMDVLNIYPGGTFEPNRKITRGELAAILASFCGTAEDSGRDRFSDISGSWARRYINQAAEAGLIYGYTDGTFRPDQNITRAETIAMVNRILGRSASADTVLRGYKTFSDVPTGAWYYRAVWTRQSGRCAYCNQRMLADQEIELVEKNIGQGWKIKNLIYIHRRCSYQVCFSSNGAEGEPIDLFSMLDGIMEEVPAEESPYVELTEFFRTNKNSVIHLRFQEIERILGDRLPWEAYCFEAFWYDDTPELSSSLWKKEDYPFHTIRFTAPEYNIIHSWTRQGYKIKALHLETNQVTFRRENKNMSGITLPKTLTDQRLPDDVAYNFQKLVKQFIKDNGL